jgi:hypothetical protein
LGRNTIQRERIAETELPSTLPKAHLLLWIWKEKRVESSYQRSAIGESTGNREK